MQNHTLKQAIVSALKSVVRSDNGYHFNRTTVNQDFSPTLSELDRKLIDEIVSMLDNRKIQQTPFDTYNFFDTVPNTINMFASDNLKKM